MKHGESKIFRDSNILTPAHALKFRPASLVDLPLVNQLMRSGKAYWGYPEDALDRFMKVFGIRDGAYFNKAFGFMAESDQHTIGYYLFKTDEQPPSLDYFFLNVRFIGQGYGRYLWDHCVTQGQKRGWANFTFCADPHAQGFYEHMGAIKIKERPMVTLPGHMAPVMVFTIPNPKQAS
jgi:GNAT superfamily N-acetyltransferase